MSLQFSLYTQQEFSLIMYCDCEKKKIDFEMYSFSAFLITKSYYTSI
jgi:hypothetical protein